MRRARACNICCSARAWQPARVSKSGAFLKSRPDLETPDLQFHFIAALMFDHTRRKADRHGFMAHVCQLRPESRGYISLQDRPIRSSAR